MLSEISISGKRLRIVLTLVFLLLAGIIAGLSSRYVFSENAKFESFCNSLFKEEVSANTLTLHYSLAEPQNLGISDTKISLGTIDTDFSGQQKQYQDCLAALKGFSPDRLSRENQIALDTLLLYFDTKASLGESAILEEILGPSLGIQAQLPVLLAEYAFYTHKDISDYLSLLTSIRPYFRSIISFEQKKASAGYFMSNVSLDRILRQCRSFVENPEENYMQEIFLQKIEAFPDLNQSEKAELSDFHKKLLEEDVFPAYQELIQEMSRLRGKGRGSRGLSNFENGQYYYENLLKQETGSFIPVNEIEKKLTAQLLTDCRQLSRMANENPALLSKAEQIRGSLSMEPAEMLESLRKMILSDFPELGDASYELRRVHTSMEDFLSPAFYLTPPMDTQSPNVIYLNNPDEGNSLELFTTLAHEGFPGHLYQTLYFSRKNPAPIRQLISCGGYVEGWATYIEEYAGQYAAALIDTPDAADAVQLNFLNKRISLCIYSLLDINIHYKSWTQPQTAAFLSSFGIRDAAAAAEIYQYIVETPGNYLKYCLGSLSFNEIKDAQKASLKEDFQLKEFHRQVLDIGPVPFPVLKKYMAAG